eukprot:CAMPEP_0180763414 /NCGR_PEP_ID=MMETSP1038_2-20121128/37894_1 /TAXON_ID=632150 /ORGANISM="Azadinium spinosum, Strain 3D9" /LENGTH=621 /DNA_ID=CAMNT_0022797747 /DNA_START=43 /DNA_END=1905 /DNA_ORIENTATION=-
MEAMGMSGMSEMDMQQLQLQQAAAVAQQQMNLQPQPQQQQMQQMQQMGTQQPQSQQPQQMMGGTPGAARASADNTTVLRMRGLPFRRTAADIKSFFEGFQMSRILPVTLMADGRPGGEAYVEFTTEDEALRAFAAKQNAYLQSRYVELFPSTLFEMNQKGLGQEIVYAVELAPESGGTPEFASASPNNSAISSGGMSKGGGKPTRGDALKVFAGGLPKDASEAAVRTFFSNYGTVTGVQLKYTDAGVFRGFGFISFSRQEEASAVVMASQGGSTLMQGKWIDCKEVSSDASKGKGGGMGKGCGGAWGWGDDFESEWFRSWAAEMGMSEWDIQGFKDMYYSQGGGCGKGWGYDAWGGCGNGMGKGMGRGMGKMGKQGMGGMGKNFNQVPAAFRPAPAPPVEEVPLAEMTKDALVAKVKSTQKLSPEAKQKWYDYCQSAGQGSFDPARHEEDFLRTFFSGGFALLDEGSTGSTSTWQGKGFVRTKDRCAPEKIFVGGLPQSANIENVFKHFSQFGPVMNVDLKYDEMGSFRGFGFVTFQEETTAQLVILNGANNIFDGKWVDCKAVTEGGPVGGGKGKGGAFAAAAGNLGLAGMQNAGLGGMPDVAGMAHLTRMAAMGADLTG